MSPIHQQPVQRINFIEKAPFVLTYRKMISIGGALFGLILMIYGFQIARTFLMEKRITQLNETVSKLKADREKALQEVASEAGGPAGARSILLKMLNESVSWSVFLRELTSQTPRSLWLTSFKSYEKADASSRRGVILNGRAEDAGTVAHFLKALSLSPLFENVVLSSSKQGTGNEGSVYEFSIDLAVKMPKGGGRM